MSSFWKAREASSELLSQLRGTLEIPDYVLQLLAHRGVSSADQIDEFLHPKLSSLKDPSSLIDMNEACGRLVTALEKQEKICVYADFDLDGTSGLALMLQGLAELSYKNVQYAQPKRLSEGYGFHSHIVEELAAQGVSLIITVDVGITAYEACETAKKLNIDVIVTDHHQTGEKLPNAFAVVNPNRKDCTSGLGYLSGAGVGFYLLRALKRALFDKALISKEALDLRGLLDCFTIATLTDMVPLVGDNRVLVRNGLLEIAKTKRPGLMALLKQLNLDQRPLNSQDVAIRYAPKLNALSRMESGLLPIDIFLIDSMEKAESMVHEILENNSNRVQLQMAGEQEAMEMLNEWPHKDFVFLCSNLFHRGVVGLIATKLSQHCQCPAFIGSIDESGVVTGSARIPGGYSGSALAALGSVGHLLNRHGGHQAAAGFEFEHSKLEQVIQVMSEHFKIQEEQEQTIQEYDLELAGGMLTDGFMNWLDRIGPYGVAFPVPLCRIKNLNLVDAYDLKGGHLKLKLECSQSRKRFDGLMFSSPLRASDVADKVGKSLDVYGEVQWNYFAGKKSLQILIKEFSLNS